jgi:insecticidal toxin complex protein TccC
LHEHTPSLSVIEPRGLPVRAVVYHRRAAGVCAKARVTQQLYDAAGRLTRQRDPRLFALVQGSASVPANLSSVHSLSSQVICSESVDAGWHLGLSGLAGQAIESWDQRGWHCRSVHDPLLRPIAVFEKTSGETERCVERMTWGGADEARHNRCGQPIRQDDPAGSRLMVDYGMSATRLCEIRHFLQSLDTPDWPVTEGERNRLLEPGDGALSSWHFAASGEVIKQADAKEHSRHFAHDRAGQLRTVRLQRSGQPIADTLVSAIDYNAFGQVQQELAGNGMRTISAYDPANGRLQSFSTQAPDNGYLQQLSYRYDPTGNITEIADAALLIQYFANQRVEPIRRFTYDTLYQLINATGWETAKPSFGPALPEWQPFGPPDSSRWCNYSETYHYDEAGNVLQRIHQGAENDTLTLRVAPYSNRSVKAQPGQPEIDKLFDARGNLLELQPGQRLQWSGRNQLAQVIQVLRPDDNHDLEHYIYDSEGQRLRKWRKAAAKAINHTAEVRYLPGIELHSNSATEEQLQVVSVQAGRCTVRLLHWDSPPPAGLENDRLRFGFDDHLGSSAFEVDAQAKTISQEVYYPFGGTAYLAGRHAVESSYKTIRYSGKERDATGLYYYGARYYAPWLLRWLNPDPAGDVDGLNFYRFVKGNPLVYFDPDGRWPNLVSFLNDYIVERASGINGLIKYRGMKAIEKNTPLVFDLVSAGFAEAKRKINSAILAIDNKVLVRDVLENYLGEYQLDDVGYLYESLSRLKAGLNRYEVKPEKVVMAAPLQWDFGAVSAFVLSGDRRKKIYFNEKAISRATVETLALKIIHEVSHIDLDSLDLWFVIGSSERSSPQIFDAQLNDQDWDMIDTADGRSRLMTKGVNVNETVFSGARDRDNFVQEVGVASVGEAINKFQENSRLRTTMALKNADTIAALVGALSRKV